MRADLHLHSRFSADSEADPEAIIRSAIEKNIDVICFTDHMDYDFALVGDEFTFSPEEYFHVLEPLKEKYRDSIRVLIGIEFGMQPHLRKKFETLVNDFPFDYVLGSQHMVFGRDPYYPETFEGKSDGEVFDQWFSELAESLAVFPEIDAIAHIDYVFRYAQHPEESIPYERYEERIGEILHFLIRHGITLELNSGGFQKIRVIPDFHENLLRQYRAEGGVRIVTGSDAHTEDDVGREFDRAVRLLFEYPEIVYTYYEKRKPKVINL